MLFKIGKAYKIIGVPVIYLYTNENDIGNALECYWEPNFRADTKYPAIILNELKEKPGIIKILIDGKVGWFDHYHYQNDNSAFMLEELE